MPFLGAHHSGVQHCATYNERYSGRINRVVKIKGDRLEHFIHGAPDTTFEQALRDNWPFENYDVKKSKLRIVTEKGEDVTKSKLSSHEGTVLVELLS